MGRFRLLPKRMRLQAVAVGREAYAASNGDRDEFERLVKEDKRTKAINIALILLFIQVALAVWEYYKKQNPSSALMSDEDILKAIEG